MPTNLLNAVVKASFRLALEHCLHSSTKHPSKFGVVSSLDIAQVNWLGLDCAKLRHLMYVSEIGFRILRNVQVIQRYWLSLGDESLMKSTRTIFKNRNDFARMRAN